MRFRSLFRSAAVALACAVAGVLPSQPVNSGPEIRGLWVSRFEWPQSTPELTRNRIDAVMTRAQQARFNAVFFQVRGQAETFYPSPEEPWSKSYNYTDPGWDPLAYAIQAAHARGLEFHAYMNTHVIYQASGATPQPPPSGLTPSHPYYLNANPADPARRQWCYHTSNGQVQALGAGEDGYLWAAPGVPSYQEWVRRQIRYVAENYEVDGIHLDRIRVAGIGSHDPTSLFRHADSGNPAGLSFQNWSRDQLTRFLNDVYGTVAELNKWRWYGKPLMKVSTAPYRGESQQLSVNQDLSAWCAIGAQDFFCPQIYSTSLSAFDTALDTNFPLSHGRYVVAGLSRNAVGQTMPTIFSEMQSARTKGAAGSVVFSYTGFASGDWEQYPLNIYGNSAVTPDMPWLTNPTDAIIIGNVYHGGQPVTDAWLTRTGAGYTWVSGADGWYSMLKVPARMQLTLSASKAGVGSASITVPALAAGEVRRVNLHLGVATGYPVRQKLYINAAGTGYQELVYNYSTFAQKVTPYSASSGFVTYERLQGQWTGIYHYDYGSARYSQAHYTTGQTY